MDMSNLKVDAVIPAYKPDDSLAKLLTQLQKQSVPLNRVIIINTEKEFFNPQEYPLWDRVEIHHITKEEFDHAATRNMGMQMSDADYVLFMTMDAVPVDEYLVDRLLDGFNNKEIHIAVTYARQIPKNDCRMAEKYTREFNYPDKDRLQTAGMIKELGIKTYFCSDVCAMYDRAVYNKLGGFVKRAIFNEDMFFAAKAVNAGYGIGYCAEAGVIHSHNYSLKQQFSRNFDIGVSQAEHPDIFEKVSSESEGLKLVKSTAAYLVKHGHWYDVPYLILSSGFKYAGFRLGKRYERLSKKRILKYTMNKNYWRDLN